jgi:hypothetical protein
MLAVCSNVVYGRVEWLLVFTNTRVKKGGWFCIAHDWWTWRSEQQRWVRHSRTVDGHWTDGGTFNSDGDGSHFQWWRLLCSSDIRVTVELLPLCQRARDGRSTWYNYILDLCMIRGFLESIVSLYLIDSTFRYGGILFSRQISRPLYTLYTLHSRDSSHPLRTRSLRSRKLISSLINFNYNYIVFLSPHQYSYVKTYVTSNSFSLRKK